MLEILQYAFMQRAIIAGIVLACLLAWLGVFVIMRKMSFFSDGIAHASLAGVAVGVVAGIHPLTTALIFSVIFSIVIYSLEKKTTLSSDAIIGILFTSGMAFGVVLISFKSGYQPDLVGFLFGNILAIRTADLAVISALSAGIMAFLAVSVVLGLKILGIILVSALLIIPASTAKLVSKSFKGLIVQSVVFSEIVVILGITLSYYLDSPTGPMIVLVGTGVFLVIFSLRRLIAPGGG
jgi:ABC-type Mn2+/Zn2+ transport system permease subunit